MDVVVDKRFGEVRLVDVLATSEVPRKIPGVGKILRARAAAHARLDGFQPSGHSIEGAVGDEPVAEGRLDKLVAGVDGVRCPVGGAKGRAGAGGALLDAIVLPVLVVVLDLQAIRRGARGIGQRVECTESVVRIVDR